MTRVRKIRKALLLLALISLCTIKTASSDLLYIEGEMNSSVTAYITKRFSGSKGSKNLTYRLYLPRSSTDGTSTQAISNIRKSFNPPPTNSVEFTDKYGNSGIEFIWNKEIRVIQVDLQFDATIYSNFYPLTSEAQLPVAHDEQHNLYLESTRLAPSNDYFINYIGKNISRRFTKEIDAVNSVFLWLDRNIRLINNPDSNSDNDARSVLEKREGNEKGICNLAAALFKGMGIPARVVYGISFQKEVTLNAGDTIYVYDLPNYERYWIEVFFPDLGWISYDPHGAYFGLLSHIITLSYGADSDQASEVWSIEQGDVTLYKDFIFDIQSDSSVLEFRGYGNENVSKMVISPLLPELKTSPIGHDLDDPKEDAEKKELNPGVRGIVLQNSNISRRLDVVATKERVYAQRFTINFPLRFNEIRLPLLKFGDNGAIWVEIYADQNGMPGEPIFRTYKISSSRIRYMMMDNPWLDFQIETKTPPLLEIGSYWFALRSSGNCIFNWYANEGNTIGGGNDTRSMDLSLKNRGWNSILNFDLNFQLIGTREPEKKPD